MNLLRNAAEAVANQECREIALLTEASAAIVTDSAWSIMVRGFPMRSGDKLFQPFVSTKKTGMGVGLSICHTIITAHGGHLWSRTQSRRGHYF